MNFLFVFRILFVFATNFYCTVITVSCILEYCAMKDSQVVQTPIYIHKLLLNTVLKIVKKLYGEGSISFFLSLPSKIYNFCHVLK